MQISNLSRIYETIKTVYIIVYTLTSCRFLIMSTNTCYDELIVKRKKKKNVN